MSLKQSSNEPPNLRPGTAENDRDCWQRDRNCTCLKIEIPPGELFIFPYLQFLSAQHTRANGDETLRIAFGTHQIIISGSQLGEIAAALQELAVVRIGVVPSRYRQLRESKGAWVTGIEVKPSE